MKNCIIIDHPPTLQLNAPRLLQPKHHSVAHVVEIKFWKKNLK